MAKNEVKNLEENKNVTPEMDKENPVNENETLMEEMRKLKEELQAEREAIAKEREDLTAEKEKIAAELKLQRSDVVISKEDKQNDFEEAKRTPDKLNKDLVNIKIPVDKENPGEKLVPVTINGWTWTIKRGETVEVPVAVAELLEGANYL